ncbi:hypothetical protein Tco_1130692 [Tanacetum coccineum]
MGINDPGKLYTTSRFYCSCCFLHLFIYYIYLRCENLQSSSKAQESNEKKEEGSEEKAKGSRKKMLGRKRAGKEQQQESSKKQRMEEDKETDEVEEVEEDDEAKMKKHLGIDRKDLLTLWKLVKTKHGDKRPKDEHERVMWGDFKVMFELDIRSKVWRDLQGYTVTV